MVRCISKLACDAADGLMLGHQQASDILGKVNAGGFIGEDIPKLEQQLFHDLWQCNDRWHRTLPRSTGYHVDHTSLATLVQICKTSAVNMK